MWGLPPPHPFSKKRHIGRSAEWAGMLPFQRRRTMLISTREPSLAILLDTCLWTLPTSLFFSSPNTIYWRMLHCPAAKPRVATGQGREVFFPRHRCSVERTEYLMRFFCLVISIYIYIVIVLYSYILISILR